MQSTPENLPAPHPRGEEPQPAAAPQTPRGPGKRWLPSPERLANASHRILPDFLILGAMKAGTTTLYDMLRAHPRILPAWRKEVHFFDLPDRWSRGLDFYRAFFPTRNQRLIASARAAGRVLTGEASPYYLYHPHAPARITQTLPNAKFIVLLRDPVTRAFSHYQHARREGWDDRAFARAVRDELQNLGALHRIVEADPALFLPRHQHHEYIHRGHYAEQLERWFALAPRDRFLILRAESFFHDPLATFEQTCAFLGLPAVSLPTPQISNRGDYRDQVDPETRQLLHDHFQPVNARLHALLGWRDDRAWGHSSP